MRVPEDDPRTSLPASLENELSDRVEHSPGFLVGLDFDGTLAPIESNPDAPRIDPALRERVESLARHDAVRVAVVSGRAVDDLAPRVGLPGLTYAGNHGMELRRNGRTVVQPDARRHRPAVQQVLDRVASRLSEIPGVVVEDKGVTGTVHYRSVPDDLVPNVHRVVHQVAETVVAESSADLAVTEGKAILEIRPAIPWDKGRVLRRLLADVPADWDPIYVGDDTTDEDAFEAIEPSGLGVRVGDDGTETAASFVLPDQSAVAPMLTHLDERLRRLPARRRSERQVRD